MAASLIITRGGGMPGGGPRVVPGSSINPGGMPGGGMEGTVPGGNATECR